MTSAANIRRRQNNENLNVSLSPAQVSALLHAISRTRSNLRSDEWGLRNELITLRRLLEA